MDPYKIQLTQELKINNHRQCCVFSDWVLEQLEVNPNFAKEIIFRWGPVLDEWIYEQAKLSNLGRYQFTRDTPASKASRENHCLVRILVWRNHRSVLLPKRSGRCHNHQRRALQIDDKQLLVAWKWMIWIPITYGSNRMALHRHTSHATMDILHERFESTVISRGGDVNWLPRLCNLTPLDFFLWLS